MKNLEFTVSNKKVSITSDYILIWDPREWDGKNKNRQQELLEKSDTTKFAGYDRSDGVPYYWTYPIEAVVDAIDIQIASLRRMDLKEIREGKELLSDNNWYTFEKDSIIDVYGLYGITVRKLLWVKKHYFDPYTGEITSYLVAEL